MGLAGFTLADRLGAKSSPCTVPGCTRTWISMAGGKIKLGGRGAPDPADPASSMCDPCRQAFARATDLERPCDRPGCDGTWTWSARDQVEAFAQNRKPPHNLCASCETKIGTLEDRSLPCAVPGCARTAVFSKRAQLLAGAPEIEVSVPALRCAQCEGVYRKLKDRPVTCGINGCKEKWTWSADEQIQAYASGLTNDPPRRMGQTCQAAFGAIADRQIRCRTSGCKKTWTWTRGDQLDACVAGKPAPKAPHRMCESCVGIYQSLKDVERPCRRSGCKRTWLDKRGGQLARAVRGKTGDPYPQYCETCAKELGDLEDRQIPCKSDNCTGTWTWTKAAQLAAGVHPTFKADADGGDGGPEPADLHANGAADGPPAETALPAGPPVDAPLEAAAEPGLSSAGAAAGAEESLPVSVPGSVPVSVPISSGKVAPGRAGGKRKARGNRKRRREVRPPERRCQTCLDFLAEKKTAEIACKHCGTPIYWPPESQLQTHLGAWAEPSMCGACKRDATEAARVAQREALRAGGVVVSGQTPPPPSAEPPHGVPAEKDGEGHPGAAADTAAAPESAATTTDG